MLETVPEGGEADTSPCLIVTRRLNVHGGQEWARLAHAVPADASRSECTVAPKVLHDVQVSLSKSDRSSAGTLVLDPQVHTEVSLLLLCTDPNRGGSVSDDANECIRTKCGYGGKESNDGISEQPDETDMWL